MRFSGVGGERVVIPNIPFGATGRIYDPFGREVLNQSNFYNGNSFVLQATGQYLVLIEGYPQAASGTQSGTTSTHHHYVK